MGIGVAVVEAVAPVLTDALGRGRRGTAARTVEGERVATVVGLPSVHRLMLRRSGHSRVQSRATTEGSWSTDAIVLLKPDDKEIRILFRRSIRTPR